MTTYAQVLNQTAANPTGCLVWQGSLDRDGYGRIKVNGLSKAAHRVSYEMAIGPIPSGMHLDHLCRNRACINPRHLEPVTPRENVMRSFRATNRVGTALGGTCRRGHPFDASNTCFSADGRRRSCRACTALRRQRYLAKSR